MLVLGMLMDQASMLMLGLPFFIPLAHSIGIDLVWFGIILLMALEISFTTPPFGLLLFVMLGLQPDLRLGEVISAVIPYWICNMILVILLLIFPQIALMLPGLIK
jgi:TRAP-type C4-dicarboxylate transport system permease large subunit